MTPQEKARALRPLIEKAVSSLTDEDALEAVELFEHWKAGMDVVTGDRLSYNDVLYKVLQSHTTQEGWEPDVAVSLFTVVVVDEEQGTKDNPIPYSGNMALEAGLYYTQDGVEYLCFRDTGIPVYNALADLVGLYVEVVS